MLFKRYVNMFFIIWKTFISIFLFLSILNINLYDIFWRFFYGLENKATELKDSISIVIISANHRVSKFGLWLLKIIFVVRRLLIVNRIQSKCTSLGNFQMVIIITKMTKTLIWIRMYKIKYWQTRSLYTFWSLMSCYFHD